VDLSLGPEVETQDREDFSNRDGCRVVEMIKAKKEGTRVVVVSGHPDTQVAADVLQHSGADYFQSKEPLFHAPLAGAADPLRKIITGQLQLAKLNLLDGFENPVRAITQGRDSDLWRHNAVAALQPTFKDESLNKYLGAFLEELGPVRRKKRAAALMDVRVKDNAVEGVFWSKALGMAVHVVLGTPREKMEGIFRACYGDALPQEVFRLDEFLISGSGYVSPEPRSAFVEP